MSSAFLLGESASRKAKRKRQSSLTSFFFAPHGKKASSSSSGAEKQQRPVVQTEKEEDGACDIAVAAVDGPIGDAQVAELRDDEARQRVSAATTRREEERATRKGTIVDSASCSSSAASSNSIEQAAVSTTTTSETASVELPSGGTAVENSVAAEDRGGLATAERGRLGRRKEVILSFADEKMGALCVDDYYDCFDKHNKVSVKRQPRNNVRTIRSKRFMIASSKNVAHRLLCRSLRGGGGGMRRQLSQHAERVAPWSVAKWILFPGYRGFISVTQVAWDPQGDLLAVAYYNSQQLGVFIAIYDWHTVYASDLAGRRRRQRGDQEAVANEPILAIPVRNSRGAPVQVMEWNPYNPDELVVGLR